MDLEAFQLVLLRRPSDAPDLPPERLDELQRDHLAFYDALRLAGQVVANGPFDNQPDESWRGIAIFATESEEAARTLAAEDPLVLAGRLVNDVMSWWTRPGLMARPGRPVQIDEP